MSEQTKININALKKELNAVIIAHYYQPPEIQDIADFVGDSLQLAIQASETAADVIVTCGVKFMAESAKILSPDKMVLLPVPDAGCPMADMVTADDVRRLKQEHPNSVVVCYVNSSAEVKAESDICCTSANALKVVESLPADQAIIFVPDKNLGSFIEQQTGRSMIKWEGYCPVHHALKAEHILEKKQEYPGSVVLVHPECRPEVTALADGVMSTGGIFARVKAAPDQQYIIGTEEGFLYGLHEYIDRKRMLVPYDHFICEDMKKISLEDLETALVKKQYQITVPQEIRQRAYSSLQRMIQIR